jgi:hypothetical protein
VSAVLKLTKASPAPACVYRPHSSSNLPEALVGADGGLHAAVERGCLSATVHKSLAAAASAALTLFPAVLEIRLGQVCFRRYLSFLFLSSPRFPFPACVTHLSSPPASAAQCGGQ